MSEKGFKAKKQPSKAKMQEQHNEAMKGLQFQLQILGQQLFNVNKQVQSLSSEVGAMANLLRLELSSESAKDGDTVMIDFSGVLTESGKTFEGGSALGTVVKLGSKQFIPGFEEQLVGIKPEETRVVKVKFPEEYVEHLKGKEAEFTVKAKKIWSPKENDAEIALLHAKRLEAQMPKEEEIDAAKTEEKAE